MNEVSLNVTRGRFGRNMLMHTASFIFCCLVYVYYICYYQSSANASFYVNGQYPLFPMSLIVLIVGFCYKVFFTTGTITQAKVIMMLLLCFCCICFILAPDVLKLSNELVVNLLCCYMGASIFFFHLYSGRFLHFFWAVNLITIAQVVLALYQLYRVLYADQGRGAVTGLWPSSDTLAVYLVACYPLFLHSVGSIKQRRLQVAGIAAGALLAAAVGFLLYFIGTPLLAVVFAWQNVVYTFLLYKRYTADPNQSERDDYTLREYRIFLAVLLMVIALAFLIPQPQDNRSQLVRKVCMEQIRKNPFMGAGIGTFQSHYPDWQAAYIEAHPELPVEYRRAATETTTAGNEYLQLLTEVGILGLLVIIATLALAICTHLHLTVFEFYAYIRIFLISVCVLASQFPVFHCNALLYLLVLVVFMHLLIFNGYAVFSHVERFKYPFTAAVTVVLIITAVMGGKRAWSAYNFNKIEEKTLISNNDLRYINEHIYPDLRSDPKFLTRMGMLAMEHGKLQEGVSYLEESKFYRSAYQTVYLLARAFDLQGLTNSAIVEYRFLTNYVPSNPPAWYDLFHLYKREVRVHDALSTGQYIFRTFNGSGSAGVDSIRSEIRDYLMEKQKL